MTPTDEIKPPSTLPASLSLFTSTGTLICCALPALLVSIGAGAVMAGLIEAVPQITWFGKHKDVLFPVAGVLLALAGAWQFHARSLPCPADAAKARTCAMARRTGWIVWGLSVVLFVTGVFFAYFAAGLFF
ncbi:hypothetical protein [Hyphomonas sp.]|uniref:hypothetical protein n=1 Tax=Hyphomonas sp. TaxID=87 RepID=UPI00391D6045